MKLLYGGKSQNDGEHETGSDRIAEAVQKVDCDIVINVQGDEPFPLNRTFKNN